MPRKAIKVKRRRVKKSNNNRSEVNISRSSISAAAQITSELGEIENYNKYVPRKVGIVGNLSDYSNRQDLAFERTFKATHEDLDSSLAQAGKQKAARKVLNLPKSQYKNVVQFSTV